jgi:hypothetical protein
MSIQDAHEFVNVAPDGLEALRELFPEGPAQPIRIVATPG